MSAPTVTYCAAIVDRHDGEVMSFLDVDSCLAPEPAKPSPWPQPFRSLFVVLLRSTGQAFPVFSATLSPAFGPRCTRFRVSGRAS